MKFDHDNEGKQALDPHAAMARKGFGVNERSVELFLEEGIRRFPLDLSARAEWLLDQRGAAAAEALYRLRNGVPSDQPLASSGKSEDDDSKPA